MVEPSKIVKLHPDPPDDERMIVQLSVGQLRKLIRDEIEAAKKQELPRVLYDSEEAAKILNVPETWVATKARAGEIKVTRMGHYVLFTLADLQEFARRHREV